MPTVGGTHFKYDKAGMQKAKAWSEITGKPMKMDKKSKGKKYQPGGQVSSRVTADVLQPSSLDEVAHKVLPESTRARYTARTKGGEQRHLTQDIAGVGGRKDRRRVALMALRDAIKNNPDFSDTVSFQNAKAFIENKNPSLWDRFLDLIMGMTEDPKNQQDRTMQNNNLAAMGRRGDTMIRPVNGQPAHVNPIEANMIDNFGPAGQKMTQTKGAGTINPKTGLKEYHPAGAWWKMAHPQHHGSWWTGDTEEALSAAGNWTFGQGSIADAFWDKVYYGCTGEQIGDTCYMTDEEWQLHQDLSEVQDVINEGLNIATLAWGQGEGPLVWVDSSGNVQTGDPLGDWEGQGITDLDNYEWAEGTPAACQGAMTPAKLQECYEAGGTDLTEEQLSDLQDKVDEYEDEFFEDLEEPSDPESTEVIMTKPLNVWGFSKFGDNKDTNWLDTLDKLLGKEKTAAKGGYIRKPAYQTGGQVPQGRRTYGSPMKYSMKKKKRPVQMQTSTAGMPSRPPAPQQFRGGGMTRMKPGMKMVEPYLKSYRAGGKLPKGWHV